MFNHLEKLGLEPQLYGLRWLRLLFSREFPLDQLLYVWDGLLAHDHSLKLAEWIAVAMIMHIKPELVKGDYNHSMQMLMRYPKSPNSYSTELIASAMGLKTKYETHLSMIQQKPLQLAPKVEGGDMKSRLAKAIHLLDSLDFNQDVSSIQHQVNQAKEQLTLVHEMMTPTQREAKSPEIKSASSKTFDAYETAEKIALTASAELVGGVKAGLAGVNKAIVGLLEESPLLSRSNKKPTVPKTQSFSAIYPPPKPDS